MSGRVRTLARLGTHRGSPEVLCAAYCTGEPPLVWWQVLSDVASARIREREFKDHYGEPPSPRLDYCECVNGGTLRRDLASAAGTDSWEAGYIEAVFEIGEKLRLTFQPRFRAAWRSVGVPPGPWRAFAEEAVDES